MIDSRFSELGRRTFGGAQTIVPQQLFVCVGEGGEKRLPALTSGSRLAQAAQSGPAGFRAARTGPAE